MKHFPTVLQTRTLQLLVVACAIHSSLGCSSSNSPTTSAGGMTSGGGNSATGGAKAGGGTLGNGGQSSLTSAATFTQVYTIITANCLPCHSTGAGKTSGMLDMSTRAAAYQSLLGTNGAGAPGAGSGCGTSGLLRVTPDDSATSLLWLKVDSKMQGTPPPCGSAMPFGTAAALSKADADMIATWIDDGAPNN